MLWAHATIESQQTVQKNIYLFNQEEEDEFQQRHAVQYLCERSDTSNLRNELQHRVWEE